MARFSSAKRQAGFAFVVFALALACLCLTAIQPFTLGQLPYSADGTLHLYRSAALEHSLRVDGSLWPRYSSGLVYGYGAPLFNYFPPLAYMPVVLAHQLGWSFVDGWLLTICLYLLLAGAGMFLLGRLYAGDLGGWLAAAAYLYSPYLLLDGVSRGALAELAALAALPVVFYGMTRLAWRGRAGDFTLATFAFACFIPLHTVMSLHGAALLAIYGALLAATADKRAVGSRLLLAGALALLLSAFYWLPALAESDAIKLPLIADELGHIDVARHLRPLSDILAPPQTADPTRQNATPPISLGWPQLFLAGLALLFCLRAPHRRFCALTLALSGLVALIVFMNTPASASLWEWIPLIGYTQFPWRALGLASLPLALMTALWARTLSRRPALAIGALPLVLLCAIPWTYTLYEPSVELQDIRDVQRFERGSGQLGLASYAEYLPVSADADALDPERLKTRFAEADVIPRLPPSPTLEILRAEWSGLSASMRLDSSESGRAVFDWLYAPGWAASIDGERVAVFPSAPAGLVALELPAGQFEMRLWLESTPAQSAAWALSGLGLAGALLAVFLWKRFAGEASVVEAARAFDIRLALTVMALGLAVFCFKALLLEAGDTLFKRERYGEVAAAPSLANFGDRIDLLAVELPADRINQDRFAISLNWRLHGGGLERDYSSVVTLRDPQGLTVAEAGSFAPGGLPSSNWRADAYIAETVILEIPATTPPLEGLYRLDVALYDAATLETLSVMNAAGNPQAASFEIASLPLRWDEAFIAEFRVQPLQSADNDAVAALIHAPELPASASAGDILPFSWTWQKLRAAASDPPLAIAWLDASGAPVAWSPALPLVAGYGLPGWRVGEVNRGQHRLLAPPELPAGVYRLGIRLGDGALIPLPREMTIAAPQRVFAAPDFALEAGFEWANGIVLLGYSIPAPGEIELVWSTTRNIGESLRLFVHALDAAGRIVAQWDGVPADWTRPTTGWLPGEYITTTHSFQLPRAERRLSLGWYAPSSGERVALADADALTLADPWRLAD